jgi:hypothetical protein
VIADLAGRVELSVCTSLSAVVARFKRATQPRRVGGTKESSGALDRAPLGRPDKPGDDVERVRSSSNSQRRGL